MSISNNAPNWTRRGYAFKSSFGDGTAYSSVSPHEVRLITAPRQGAVLVPPPEPGARPLRGGVSPASVGQPPGGCKCADQCTYLYTTQQCSCWENRFCLQPPPSGCGYDYYLAVTDWYDCIDCNCNAYRGYSGYCTNAACA